MSSDRQYVVIGGGLAAREAVKALRKAQAEASITLVCGEPLLPYDRPPLTKDFLLGEKPREALFYETAEQYAQLRIQTIVGVPATALDRAAHTVTLADGQVLPYSRALLATGGRAIALPVPGADLPGVMALRTLADAETVRAAAGAGRRVVVIGGGFIGLELAASLTLLGAQVTVVEVGPHIWARFASRELAESFQHYCGERGVRFLTNAKVTALHGETQVREVALADGTRLPADVVVVGIGIRPNVELAAAAGLAVDNGIVVDEFMASSDPDLYAAGDACNFPGPGGIGRRRVEHWTHANYSGRLAAQNMAGGRVPYEAIGFVWSDIFDLHLKFLGDHGAHDQTVVRGDLRSTTFTVFYLQQGRLTGCFAVNGEPREFALLRKLVQSRANVTGREAVLAQGDLKSLS